MSDERNPYAAPVTAPTEPPPAEGPRGLGPWLTGWLVLQSFGNLYLAVRFFAGTMRDVDPNAPEWSFPARGVFAILITGACIGILLKRRLGWYAYLALCAAAVPMHIARGMTNPITIALASAGPALLVWALLRKRMSVLR